MIVRTQYDDIEQNEVLWITPETCYLPELPHGFALRVAEFLGKCYGSPGQRRVWVRGPVVLNAHDAGLRILTLCVPVDQPRAVLSSRPPAPPASPHGAQAEAIRAIGVAGADHADADERGMVEHAGRQYRRVF